MLAAATRQQSRLLKLNDTITLRPPYLALQGFGLLLQWPHLYLKDTIHLLSNGRHGASSHGDDSLNTPYLARSCIDCCTSCFRREHCFAAPLPQDQGGWRTTRHAFFLTSQMNQRGHLCERLGQQRGDQISLLLPADIYPLTVLGHAVHNLQHNTTIMSTDDCISRLARPCKSCSADVKDFCMWLLRFLLLLRKASPTH